MAWPGKIGPIRGPTQLKRSIQLAGDASFNPRTPLFYPKFWDQGRPVLFDPPNLLLLFAVAVAAVFPVGRTQATELPPQRVVQSVATGWQAPFNPRFLGPVVASGKVTDLPPLVVPGRQSLEVGSQANPRLFPKAALPAARALDTPVLPARFSPTDLVAAKFPIVPPAIPSARSLDLPQLAATFRPGELPVNFFLFQAVVATTPFAQTDWPLPTQPARFIPADLQRNFIAFQSPTLPSARVLEISLPPAIFRQADNQSSPILAVTVTLRAAQFTDLPIVPLYPRSVFNWLPSYITPTPQVVTIPSAQVSDLPPPTIAFRAADLPQNFLLLHTPAATKPFAQYDWPLPIVAAPFRPTPGQPNLFPFLKPTIPSASVLDLPRTTASITPDVGRGAPLAGAVAPPFAQRDWPLPAVLFRFIPADLFNSILPPKETFTGFPFRQMDWPLPVIQAPLNITNITSTTSILVQVASKWNVFILSE